MQTFTMKTAAVISLILYLRVGLAIPLSKENVPEQTDKSVQSDSVPIALLLLVPQALPQFREDEEHTQDEDLSFIEDQIVNLLLRDAEIPFHENRVSTGVPNDESVIYAEDLKTLSPLLRSGGDVEVNIVVEEPPQMNEDSDINISPLFRADKDFKESFLAEGPLPSKEDGNLNSPAHKADVEVTFVPNESVPFTKDAALSLEDESSLPDRKLTSEDLPLERSYVISEYTSYKPTLKPVEQVVATYSKVPDDTMPILLNCAPKVVKGHLTEASPSYRSLKARSDLDEKSDVSNSSDILDLNSPASIIAIRGKRHETGVTHYKVSEDYPEPFKGNHHLVSADYPTPNMVKITTAVAN